MKHNEKSKNNRRLIAVLAMVLLLGVTPLAHAVPTLTLTDGTTTITVADGDSIDPTTFVGDYSPTPGVVTYAGALGVWNINVSTGISLTGVPFMDLLSGNGSTSAGTLTITFTDVLSVATFPPGSIMAIGGTHFGSAGSLVYNATYEGFFMGEVSFNPLASDFSGSTTSYDYVPTDIGGTLIMYVGLNHGQGFSFTSFDASIAVPEPSTLLLLGSGLTGLAFLSRRKYQSS
jgi:hypothetical protein